MARKRRHSPDALPPRPIAIGDDGWPLCNDAEHEDERRIQQRADAIQKRLRLYERSALQDRYFPALMDAFDLCVQEGLPFPSWLSQEIRAILVQIYNKPRNHRQYEAMTARRDTHLSRYDAVQELLDRRDELDQTRDSVFETAAALLGGAREDAFRVSYTKVQKAFREGEDYKFYVSRFGSPTRGGVKSHLIKR